MDRQTPVRLRCPLLQFPVKHFLQIKTSYAAK